MTHREYHEGNLIDKADSDSIYSERETEEKEFVIVGIVLQVIPEQFVGRGEELFFPGEELELLPLRETDYFQN